MSDKLLTMRAFVISPIGDRDAPDGTPKRQMYEEAVQIFEQVILPACSAFGVEAIRADQIARTGEIPEQIFRQLRDAPIVIADLTGANPNVMYELGLRHTTGKLTIQLGERERLPFDVAAIRTLMFKRTEAGLVEARRKLSEILATGLKSGGDPVTATRVWFEAGIIANIAEIGEPDDLAEDQDVPGFLEKLADTEDAMQSLEQAISAVTSITEEIARLFSENTPQMAGLRASGRLALANRIAALLEDPAIRLRVSAGEFAQSVQRMEPGIVYLLTSLAENPSQLAEAREFPKQMQALIEAAQSSIPGTLEFKKVVDGLGDIARSLGKVGKGISVTLQSIADSSARVAGWKRLIDRLSEGSASTQR